MKLLVGLGNPGRKYKYTRHNIGYRVVERVAELNVPRGTKWHRDETLGSSWIRCIVDDHEIVLARPTRFMNESGISVKALLDRFQVSPDETMIAHDDKDIPLGDYKVQANRGSAGHNGIKSVIDSLGTRDFHRFRIGIASSDRERMKDTMKFVLGRFGLLERRQAKAVINESAEKIIYIFGRNHSGEGPSRFTRHSG